MVWEQIRAAQEQWVKDLARARRELLGWRIIVDGAFLVAFGQDDQVVRARSIEALKRKLGCRQADPRQMDLPF